MNVMCLLETKAQNAGHAALTRGPGGTCLLMAIAAAVGSLALASGSGALLLRRWRLHGLLLPCSLLLCRMLARLQTVCALLELLGVQRQPCGLPGRSECGLDLQRSLANGAAWRIEGEAVVHHLQQ